ncbi:MAG: hypothetical protein JWN40_3968, partial [Phycisphaerales bacterium]|nr:hypothetical protein [Phycisphaerales bacterium]
DRLRVVIATILINVICVGLLAFVPWSSWRTGAGLNLIDNALLVGFIIVRRDRFLANLMLFGLAVGFVELASDAWLVDVLKTLDYSNGVDGAGYNPMIWRSPIWMPFAWQVVAVQFGYLGLRLYEGLGWKGLLIVGLLGSINIPYYEEMALRINWWRYQNCAMFLHTPWAIIVGEWLIAMYLGYTARWTRAEKYTRSLVAGITAGAAIFVGYAVPYWLISR